MKYAAYNEYKTSDIGWILDFPAHWALKRLKYVANRAEIKVEADEDNPLPYIGLEQVEPWMGRLVNLDDDLVPTGVSNRFEAGDTLFGKLRPYLAKACNVDFDGLCSSELLVLRGKTYDRKFLLYQLLSHGFINLVDSSTYGSKMPRASWDFIGVCELPLPSFDEQQTIARFLDAKTAQIDTLVAQKRQLIAKLKEKRQALIARTVTRGLPPEAAKAAGLEPDSDSKYSEENHPLIGSLPIGWRSIKLRRVAAVQGGYAFKSDDFQQEGIPVVRMNSLKRGVLELDGAACIDESECIEAVALRGGDVLYGMSGSVGETGSLGNFAVVRDSDVPCQLNQRVGRFLVREKELLPGFLVYLIQAPYFYDQILLQATGTAQFNVSGGQIESVLIALPSLDAQRLMVDFLDARCAEIDALQRKTEQALESLYEFRMAIVTSAVTGKIDVRGVA